MPANKAKEIALAFKQAGVIQDAPTFNAADPSSTVAIVQQRMQQIGRVEAWAGHKVSPLQPAEVEQLSKIVRILPLDQASTMLAKVGDSLGEMALYFGMAHVALLGGSFAPLGGQNLIEAAACGVPVFMGPHLFNFTEASTLAAEAGAALRCENIAHAVAEAAATAGDAARLQGMQEAALGLGAAHRGAAVKTATEVAAVVHKR